MSYGGFSRKSYVSAGVALVNLKREAIRGSDLEWCIEGFAVEIEVRVSLVDLKRAFRGLSARLPERI
jgi:hypothetical protein